MDDILLTRDPLRLAIYQALRAAESAGKALTQAANSNDLPSECRRDALGLIREIDAGTIFGAIDITLVRNLLDSLQEPIRRATRSHYVHDEHDMSGGHYEAVASSQGVELMIVRSRLEEFIEALSVVRCLLRAEQIADELRS